MFTFLKGYRTYILVFLGILVVGLGYSGFIPVGTENVLLQILGFASVGALRASVPTA